MQCFLCCEGPARVVCGCKDIPICGPCLRRAIASVPSYRDGRCPQCRQFFRGHNPRAPWACPGCTERTFPWSSATIFLCIVVYVGILFFAPVLYMGIMVLVVLSVILMHLVAFVQRMRPVLV